MAFAASLRNGACVRKCSQQQFGGPEASTSSPGLALPYQEGDDGLPLAAVNAFKVARIRKALTAAGGNQTRAAELLGNAPVEPLAPDEDAGDEVGISPPSP